MDAFKRIRKKCGNLTQAQFAVKCGVSTATISNLEEGNNVGKASLLKIFKTLCVLLEEKALPNDKNGC